MLLNWKERVKYPRLASKMNPASRKCFSKTTLLVLILRKIRHDYKTYVHENLEINAAAKARCKVVKSNTNGKIFNTTATSLCAERHHFRNCQARLFLKCQIYCAHGTQKKKS